MLLHSKNHLFFSKFTCRLIAYLSNDEILIMHVLDAYKKLNTGAFWFFAEINMFPNWIKVFV